MTNLALPPTEMGTVTGRTSGRRCGRTRRSTVSRCCWWRWPLSCDRGPAPTLGGQALYLFFVPPVLIAGALGGLGPGLLATAASLVLHLYADRRVHHLIQPGSPLFAAEWTRLAIFALLGVRALRGSASGLRTTRQQAGRARSPPRIDPRHRAGRDDRHRRRRPSSSRSARRRSGCSATAASRSARQEYQDADAVALSRGA